MQPHDLPAVERVGGVVHPNLLEDPEIFAERWQLYPAGCYVLAGGSDIVGYAIGHPWLLGHPPALNTRLQTLPTRADTFYLHDVALLPTMRGQRLGEQVVALLTQAAKAARLPSLSLVAVSGSRRFWERQGFVAAPVCKTLASYGPDAYFMTRPA